VIRLVLIVVVVLLAIVGGVAVALHHFFGWKGLVAFPFILVAMVWLGKIVIAKLAKKFFLGLFGVKSEVLRDATMTVHSIRAVPKPPEPPPDESEPGEEDDDTNGDQEADEAEPEEPEEIRHYYVVDVTITPRQGCGDRVWEPGELLLTTEKLTSLEDLQDETKEAGTTEECKVWNGSAFVPDDECKYPGEQRLLVTFAIKPGTSQAWMHYYCEHLGVLELPLWKPEA
jgi:hypothetical protein